MCGMFISGGGVTGAIAALRATPKREDFVVVGYELFDDTPAALIDGMFSLIIAHPIGHFARETIAALMKDNNAGLDGGLQSHDRFRDAQSSERLIFYGIGKGGTSALVCAASHALNCRIARLGRSVLTVRI